MFATFFPSVFFSNFIRFRLQFTYEREIGFVRAKKEVPPKKKFIHLSCASDCFCCFTFISFCSAQLWHITLPFVWFVSYKTILWTFPTRIWLLLSHFSPLIHCSHRKIRQFRNITSKFYMKKKECLFTRLVPSIHPLYLYSDCKESRLLNVNCIYMFRQFQLPCSMYALITIIVSTSRGIVVLLAFKLSTK